MKTNEDHIYTLTLTTRNRPGVLVRCAQVFGRRGHNIEALYVSPHGGGMSIMTITAFGNPTGMGQITAQLAKLIDVIEVIRKES